VGYGFAELARVADNARCPGVNTRGGHTRLSEKESGQAQRDRTQPEPDLLDALKSAVNGANKPSRPLRLAIGTNYLD
jgi:hypothetical protein